MDKILGGLVLINGTDIWTEYGAFLVEDKRGNMENLTAILTPSKVKADVAVNIREQDGENTPPCWIQGTSRGTLSCISPSTTRHRRVG